MASSVKLEAFLLYYIWRWNMLYLLLLPLFVCAGGAIWMPIVGWFIGKAIEKDFFPPQDVVKPNLGGIIGAIIGLAIWLVFVLPNLGKLLPMY